jgi:hypothetical protein
VQAESSLATASKRLHDLVERQDVVDVVRFAAQAPGEIRGDLAPSRAREVGLCVRGWKSGVHPPSP